MNTNLESNGTMVTNECYKLCSVWITNVVIKTKLFKVLVKGIYHFLSDHYHFVTMFTIVVMFKVLKGLNLIIFFKDCLIEFVGFVYFNNTSIEKELTKSLILIDITIVIYSAVRINSVKVNAISVVLVSWC